MDLRLAIFKPMLKIAMERTGHGAALGFQLTKVGRGEVEMTFPYKEEVIGNPVTGVVHGGVIVSLLDTCCGSAAITTLTSAAVTPTMDLRLDYMHPAEPRQPIYISAKVYRNSSNVIFCRGSAWRACGRSHRDQGHPQWPAAAHWQRRLHSWPGKTSRDGPQALQWPN